MLRSKKSLRSFLVLFFFLNADPSDLHVFPRQSLVSPRINPLETQRFCHLFLFGDSPPVRIETVVKIDR